MGSPLGVYDDDEIEDLTDAEREELRKAILLALKSQEVLQKFLANNQDIRHALRTEVANNFQQRSKLKLKP